MDPNFLLKIAVQNTGHFFQVSFRRHTGEDLGNVITVVPLLADVLLAANKQLHAYIHSSIRYIITKLNRGDPIEQCMIWQRRRQYFITVLRN